MSPFRGSDDTLEHEIETLEGISHRRVRRYAREMRELERDLAGLRKERARRRASVEGEAASSAAVGGEAA